MKAKLFFLITIVLATIVVNAQFIQPSGSGLLSDDFTLMKSQPSFGMQLGSSFSTGYGGGLFSQSITPQLTFHPGKNFSLMLGTHLSTGSFTGSSSNLLGSPGQGRLNSATVYALGAYRMNPRLIISGAAWTERNNMPAYFSPQMNPQAFNRNATGMMVGFDYRLSNNFSIGAQVNVSNGMNPFMPMHSNPFHPNPYNRIHRDW